MLDYLLPQQQLSVEAIIRVRVGRKVFHAVVGRQGLSGEIPASRCSAVMDVVTDLTLGRAQVAGFMVGLLLSICAR